MSMLDEKGFKRKRYAELLNEIEDKAKEAFGEKTNTSERSPLGIILRLFAWFLGNVYQLAEAVYNASYINTASGKSLDKLGPYVGVSREGTQYATGYINLNGTTGYTEPAGFLLRTDADVYFETMEPATFVDGSATVPIEAMEPGVTGNVAANTITIIENPNPNVTTCTNSLETTGGRDKETDPEYRDRFSLSVATGGSGTVDSIRSVVLAVSGVRAATVVENLSLITTTDGQPGRSFHTYVLGGAAQDIGNAIFSKKSAGIESFGSQSVTVKDLGGNQHIVKYSPAVVIPVYMKIDIWKTTAFPADGIAQIKSLLVKFVGGEDIDGTLYAGLTMGEDVIQMKLGRQTYNIPGVEDVQITLSTTGTTYAEQNISIQRFQVAQADFGKIEVTTHDFSD